MSDPLRILAVVHAHDEPDLIEWVTGHLVENGVDVYILADGSRDRTLDRVRRWLDRGLLGVESLSESSDSAPDGRPSAAMLRRRKVEIARSRGARWLIDHDADQFRDAPWPGASLSDAIGWVDRVGFQRISFRRIDFVPTDDGYQPSSDPQAYFTRYGDPPPAEARVTDCFRMEGEPGRGDGEGPAFPVPFLLRRYPSRDHPRTAVTDRGRFDPDRLRLELLVEAGPEHAMVPSRIPVERLRSRLLWPLLRMAGVVLPVPGDDRGLASPSESNPPAAPATPRATSAEKRQNPEDAPVLHLDYPEIHLEPRLGSEVTVSGWTFARSGIKAVEVLLDGKLAGTATHGHARPDVRRSHPDQPGAGRSGFVLVLDLSEVDEGRHEVEVKAVANDGLTRSLRGRVRVSHSESAAELYRPPDRNGQYAVWRERNRPTPADVRRASESVRCFRARPLVSLLLATGEDDPKRLAETIDSCLAQAYPNLELIVVDDASLPEIAALLDGYSKNDARVRVHQPGEAPGRGAALALALRQAKGDFVAVVGAEDLLCPLALHAVVQRLNDRPETDVLYADEDAVTTEGGRRDARFKPDWSPILLLANDYLGSFVVYRRSVVDAAGGINAALPGEHVYDLSLRATEVARRVEHLTSVLYSTRIGEDEHASFMDRRPFARAAAREALEAALARRGLNARLERTMRPEVWRIRPTLEEEPLVSILIPTMTPSHLERCLRSILDRTLYSNYEILVLDSSAAEEIAELVATFQKETTRLQRLHHPERPFSFSAINNRGAEVARGSLLLLLNDDTEILDNQWLTSMVELTRLPEVGVVGAQLVYPSGGLQHAGIILGIAEVAGHAFRFFPPHDPGYLLFNSVAREVSGVTFACALVRRDLWDRLGGLNEADLPLSYNDVDFCLRASEASARILYCPYARLLHYESATRRTGDVWKGFQYMKRRWRRELIRDPFYNPNLTTRAEDWSINLEDEKD